MYKPDLCHYHTDQVFIFNTSLNLYVNGGLHDEWYIAIMETERDDFS